MKKIIILLAVTCLLFSAGLLFSDGDKPAALVLSGGGAKGAYQIGVWKALIDLDIEIGAAYGVSVGAINGAVIASGDYLKARDLWLGISKSDVMKINKAGENVLSGSFSLGDLIDAAWDLWESEGIDVSPLRILLNETIDEQKIRTSGRDFGLLAFSLTDFQTEYAYFNDIPDGKLIDYILASANFPIFQRQVIGGKEFVDGGVYKNIPIELVDPEKTPEAIIISLDFYTPIDVFDVLTRYNSYDLDVKIISPSGDLGSILDFDADNSKRLMIMGYLDGLRFYDAVSGRKYFLNCCEDIIRPMFFELTRAEVEEACSLLEVGLGSGDAEDIYARVIIPELCREVERVYGSDALFSVEDYPAALIESMAERVGVSEMKLYTPAGLAEAAVRNYIARDDAGVYYNRYFDFVSYLWLKTEYRLQFQIEPEGLYQAGLNSFSSGGE